MRHGEGGVQVGRSGRGTQGARLRAVRGRSGCNQRDVGSRAAKNAPQHSAVSFVRC